MLMIMKPRRTIEKTFVPKASQQRWQTSIPVTSMLLLIHTTHNRFHPYAYESFSPLTRKKIKLRFKIQIYWQKRFEIIPIRIGDPFFHIANLLCENFMYIILNVCDIWKALVQFPTRFFSAEVFPNIHKCYHSLNWIRIFLIWLKQSVISQHGSYWQNLNHHSSGTFLPVTCMYCAVGI